MMDKIVEFLKPFPADSRVWFFITDNALSEDVAFNWNEELQSFLIKWAAHGHQLSAQGKLFERRILVVAVNEVIEGASGCSIDTLNQFLRTSGTTYQINFFNRFQAAMLQASQLVVFTTDQLESAFSEGQIQNQTQVLNTHLGLVGAFLDNPTTSIQSSWLRKYIPNIPVLE